MEKIICKSQRSGINTFIMVLGVILFSFLMVQISKNSATMNNPEPLLKTLFLTGFSLIIACIIFYWFNQKRITIYNNRFEIQRLFSAESFLFDDVKSHSIKRINAKYNSWTEHYLTLDTNKKITLIEEEYSNSYDIFHEIESRIPGKAK